MTLRVLHVCYSDQTGGAAKAAYRIHDSLRRLGTDSRMLVVSKSTDDPAVIAAYGSPVRRIHKIRSLVSPWIMRLQQDDNNTVRSLNLFPSRLLSIINKSPADVVNLHWLGAETLSIENIGNIRKPVIWTLHDMWAFLGTAHYDSPECAKRWREGYLKSNRPISLRGPDLDRWNYNRKRRSWSSSRMQFVTPSNWLKSCAQESALLSGYSCRVIPNTLDSTIYTPADRILARTKFNLPQEAKLLLFGAMTSTADPRKGFDSLQLAIQRSTAYLKSINCEIAIFGATQTQAEIAGIRVHNLGHLNDDRSIALAYAGADCFVAPSKQDNLPNTVLEAVMCGVPVVAFKIGGMTDLVQHQETGYLATPFDADDLAAGIKWAISTAGPAFTNRIRSFAIAKFSEEEVARRYMDQYQTSVEFTR